MLRSKGEFMNRPQLRTIIIAAVFILMQHTISSAATKPPYNPETHLIQESTFRGLFTMIQMCDDTDYKGVQPKCQSGGFLDYNWRLYAPDKVYNYFYALIPAGQSFSNTDIWLQDVPRDYLVNTSHALINAWGNGPIYGKFYNLRHTPCDSPNYSTCDFSSTISTGSFVNVRPPPPSISATDGKYTDKVRVTVNHNVPKPSVDIGEFQSCVTVCSNTSLDSCKESWCAHKDSFDIYQYDYKPLENDRTYYFRGSTLIPLSPSGTGPSSSTRQSALSAYDKGHAGQPSTWNTAYKKIFQNQKDIVLLRKFRDQHMTKDESGALYTSVLYDLSKDVLRTLLSNPYLLSRAKYLHQKYRLDIAELVETKEHVVLHGSRDILNFINEFSDESEPSTRLVFRGIAKDMAERKAAGKPFLGFYLK